MTNNFIFESSPSPKPKEKKVEVTWHIMPPRLKKWGDTSPGSPIKLRPWVDIRKSPRTRYRRDKWHWGPPASKMWNLRLSKKGQVGTM